MKRLFTTLSLLSFILLLSPAYFAQAAMSDKADLSDKLTGRILLQVEDKGQAYYVDPVTKQRAYLGRPADAFQVMRELGLGISNANLAKIPDPGENGADVKLAKSLAGRIVLQVEDKGQAYYINPADLKKYYLGKPADAFAVMRNQGLGITNDDLDKVPVFQKYKEKVAQLERKIEQIEGTGKVLGEGVKKQDEVITKQQEQIEEMKKQIEEMKNRPSTPQDINTPQTINNKIEPARPPDSTPTPITLPSLQTIHEDPELTLTRLENLENSSALKEGDTNKTFLAFKIIPNKLIGLNSVRVGIDDNSSLTNVTNLGLYEYPSNTLLNKFDRDLLASNLNITIDGEKTLLVKGDISNTIRGSRIPAFYIKSNSQINTSPLARISGLPIEGKQMAIRREIYLAISKASDSQSGNIVADMRSAILAKFNITATGDDIKLDNLSVAIDRSEISNDQSATNNGSERESFLNGKILLDGSQVGTATSINEGNLSVANGSKFGSFGNTLIIQRGQTRKLTVVADVVSNGTPLKDMETVKVFLLPGNNNVLGATSPTTTSTKSAEGNTLTVKKTTISVVKSSSFVGCETAKSCQDRKAGSANVKIGEFVLRVGGAEQVDINLIKFSPLNHAKDYGDLTVKTSSGQIVCATTAIGTSFDCLPYSAIRSPEIVLSVYTNKIADMPESIDVVPYEGLIVDQVRGIGTVTDITYTSSQSVILQKLYIAPSCSNSKIGDTCEGGILISKNPNLISAPADCTNTNTCPIQESLYKNWSIALSTCQNLSTNDYHDWYLPTLDELNFLYEYRISHIEYRDDSSFMVGGNYWSSTPYDNNSSMAWLKNFSTKEENKSGGSSAVASKASVFLARCVRKLN